MNTPTLDWQPTPEQQRLGPVFSRVSNPTDWKSPIDAFCPDSEKALVAEAIRFYTATDAEFLPTTVPGWSRVRSIGYRRGPAGDH